MMVIEGKCMRCFGNLVVNEDERTVVCEDCGLDSEPKDIPLLYRHVLQGIPPFNMSNTRMWNRIKSYAVEYGPEEMRHRPTIAGAYIMKMFYKGLADTCYDVQDLRAAMRGMLTDEKRIEELRMGGFII